MGYEAQAEEENKGKREQAGHKQRERKWTDSQLGQRDRRTTQRAGSWTGMIKRVGQGAQQRHNCDGQEDREIEKGRQRLDGVGLARKEEMGHSTGRDREDKDRKQNRGTESKSKHMDREGFSGKQHGQGKLDRVTDRS